MFAEIYDIACIWECTYIMKKKNQITQTIR